MMDYIKRRFSSGEIQNDSTDDIMNIPTLSDSNMNIISRQSVPESKMASHINLSNRRGSYANQILNLAKGMVNQQTEVELTSQTISKEKSKLLFVIDNQQIDW
jgi:hypothetical protein